MRKLLVYIVTIFLFTFCSFISTQHESLSNPTELVTLAFHQNLDELEILVEELNSTAQNYYIEKQDLIDLKGALSNARNSYKKVEFLLDYLDRELSTKYLNGAPLPKVEEHVAKIVIQKPIGLQTLDELIYIDSEKEEIKDIAKTLLKHVRKGKTYLKERNIEDRYIFEAARYGILRVFTLGVTGFDTPGSSNGITESIISFEIIKKTLAYYQSQNNNVVCPLGTKVIRTFDNAIQYMEANNNFDTFNRLIFHKAYISILYRDILLWQKELGIELQTEVDHTNKPHNYMSESIFDLDFLNATYYTQIAQEDLYKEEIISLEKTLFYDPILSKDLKMSCASCHNPNQGFTDELPKSRTSNSSGTTKRHSPTLLNSAYYGQYFWDMREYDLVRQVKHVVHDNLEFNIDFLDLADRLKTSEDYLALFKNAYGERDKYQISPWSISNSIAAYVTSLSSWNSPFDEYMKGNSKDLSESAKRGFNLFMGKAACGTCHFAPSFSGIVPPFYQDSESEVLGVTMTFDTIHPVLDTDLGRISNGRVRDQVDFFSRSFKTATVRNAAITPPYMHNGSLNTLQELMHFYNKGGGAGLGLNVPHQTLSDNPLNLTNTEMTDIISFMESLTDTVGMTSVVTELPGFRNNEKWNDRKIGY